MKRHEDDVRLRAFQIKRNRVAALLATGLLVGLSACGTQQPNSQESSARVAESHISQVVRLTVPQGTEVHVTLSGAVGSETSQVGDTVSATTTAPVVVASRVAIPQGSTIRGRVTEVTSGTKGLEVSEKGGAVSIAFDEVTTPRGEITRMSGTIASVAKSGGKTAGIIGGSAAGGALLGKLLGGSTKDAAIGAVVGGGIGTGIAAGTKGKALVIPAGTHLAITLDQPLTIADRS